MRGCREWGERDYRRFIHFVATINPNTGRDQYPVAINVALAGGSEAVQEVFG